MEKIYVSTSDKHPLVVERLKAGEVLSAGGSEASHLTLKPLDKDTQKFHISNDGRATFSKDTVLVDWKMYLSVNGALFITGYEYKKSSLVGQTVTRERLKEFQKDWRIYNDNWEEVEPENGLISRFRQRFFGYKPVTLYNFKSGYYFRVKAEPDRKLRIYDLSTVTFMWA